jgi:hypothetical protein
MGKWYVVVSDIIKEVYLLLLQEQAGGNRVDGSITPTFVEESSIPVERLEVVDVCLRSQPIEIANFEVGPLDIQLDQGHQSLFV